MSRFVVISGCSGGGKSTLLAELSGRGYPTVTEPGRRIVEEELASGGSALPWSDPVAFAERAIAMAMADLETSAEWDGWVFFDRGLVDAASYLETLTGKDALAECRADTRYHARVFLTPPWPEIYEHDSVRRHDMAAAQAEYDRLCETYPALGYETVILPKLRVALRADFVLASLGTGA